MQTRRTRSLVVIALAAAAAGLAGCAAEAPAPAATATGGEFDMDALVEAAQAEGSLTYYGDAAQATMQTWADSFTDEYGIPVTIVRDPVGPLYQRFAQESAAGQQQADVISLLDHGALDESVDNGWLAEYTPQEADGLNPDYNRDGWYYSVQGVTTPVIIYNTDNVTADEVEQLTDDPIGFLSSPGLADRVGVLNPQAGKLVQSFWYLYSDGPASDDFGWETLEGIAGNTGAIADTVTITQNVVQGEVDFGLPIPDGYAITQITNSGAPLGFVYPDDTIDAESALAVSANAPHPNAARLFAEWAASADAVGTWATVANVEPIRTDVEDPRTYLEEPWFTDKPADRWSDYDSDEDFVAAMAADGDYFPRWNDTFGYSG